MFHPVFPRGPRQLKALPFEPGRIGSTENSVLYLMNDSMVFAVSDHLERLSKLYRISWPTPNLLRENCCSSRIVISIAQRYLCRALARFSCME
jgi:hypothetical protein